MRNGYTVALSFAGDISETIAFHRDEATVRHNFETTERFLTSLKPPEPYKEKKKEAVLWKDIPASSIVDDFLLNVKTHDRAKKVKTELLRDYIKKQLPNEELTSWTVALLTNPGSAAGKKIIAGHEVGLIERAYNPDLSQPSELGVYIIRRLVSPVDEMIDLGPDDRRQALEATQQAWTIDRGRSRRTTPPDVPSGQQIRKLRDRSKGLLLIYPLAPKDHVESNLPVIGFALSFPDSDSVVKVKYTVNNVFWRQEYAEV
jgi:hypothetical protein